MLHPNRPAPRVVAAALLALIAPPPLPWRPAAALGDEPTALAATDRARPPAFEAPAPAPAPEPSAPGPWAVARRSVALAPGDPASGVGLAWQVDYLLRNEGPAPVVLPAGSVAAEVDGWVSNSRAPGHAAPRRSRLALATSSRGVGQARVDLIEHREESRRCGERATIAAWADHEGDEPPPRLAPEASGPPDPSPLVVPPGGGLRVRLRLEHDHFLHGPYEPLLGPRELALHLGPDTIRHDLPTDRDPGPRSPAPAWAEFVIPPELRDPVVFASAPESLHLAAHRPGQASFGLAGPVRHSTRMRLSFRYLVAPGTQGDTRAVVTQLKTGRSVHRTLYDGEHLIPLAAEGRWTRVERILRTEPEATALRLEFKLVGDVGELWIDDVSLDPLDDEPVGP